MSKKVKTKSIWGIPNASYFKFLNEITKRDLSKTVCILGCSDGKFVIYAAKRGFHVLAIDLDKIAMYGGKTTINGKQVQVTGLSQRFKIEQVEEKVELVCGDFLSYKTSRTFSGVFTSGSIHYLENAQYPLISVIDNIKRYVSQNGILFLEYIHRSDSDNDPNRHFVTKEQMASYFNDPGWTVVKHTKHAYIEKPNPRVPLTHKIIWGQLQALKNS